MACNSGKYNIDVTQSRRTDMERYRDEYKKGGFRFITELDYIQHRKTDISHQQLLNLEKTKQEDSNIGGTLDRNEFLYVSDKEFQEVVDGHKTKDNLIERNERKKLSFEIDVDNLTLTKWLQPSGKCQLNVVVIGKTGNGKSATANTIMGDSSVFKEDPTLGSKTTYVQVKTSFCNGIEVNVADTPGLFDTSRNLEDTLLEISKIFTRFSEGLNAVFFVVNIGSRFTKEELEAWNETLLHFGEDLGEHCILVFSHGNRLMGDGDTSIKDVCDEMRAIGEEETKFLGNFERRIFVVENKTTVPAMKKRNREGLIAAALDVSNHGRKLYTNEFFELAQRRKKAIKLSDDERGNLFVGIIRRYLQKNISFIGNIRDKKVTNEFILSVKEELDSEGLTFAKEEIKTYALKYIAEEEKVFEEVFNLSKRKLKKVKRPCVVL